MKAFREESHFYNLRLQYFFKNVVELKPKNGALYLQAFLHKSCRGTNAKSIDNERLEFLGDAVYNAFCIEYLYHTYPNKPEGALTQIKQKLASRSFLNGLAKELHFFGLIKHKLPSNNLLETDVPGNTLEAFFGAVYLDLGVVKFQKWLSQIFKRFIDIDKVIVAEKDYKSLFWMHCQSIKKEIQVSASELFLDGRKHYKITLSVDDLGEISADARNKKTAQQQASKLFLKKLGKL